MTKYFKESYQNLFKPSMKKLPFFASVALTILGAIFIVNGFKNTVYIAFLVATATIYLIKSIKVNDGLRSSKKSLCFIGFLVALIPLPMIISYEVEVLSAKLSNELITSIMLLLVGYIGVRISLAEEYNVKKKISQGVAYTLLTYSVIGVLSVLGLIISYIFINGLGAINLEFLTKDISNMGAEGGVFPAIVGTILLGLGTLFTAVPLGVGTAVYLNEYSNRRSKSVLFVRTSVNVLYATPSIVFGLFGLALFVPIFGISLITGALILGFLVLPLIISASEEALAAVPQELRNSSLALGATKWQTIKSVVLPAAIPGIITSV